MRTGATLGALASYVRVADGQAAIAGEFTTMIERLTEEHPKQQITVIAYSFGSIVTLDALFPTTIGPPHSFDKVVTLVTVGSPYDFVCALRPNWKDGRHHAQSPPQWINIYSTIDLMGSNYRNDTDGPERAERPRPRHRHPGRSTATRRRRCRTPTSRGTCTSSHGGTTCSSSRASPATACTGARTTRTTTACSA